MGNNKISKDIAGLLSALNDASEMESFIQDFLTDAEMKDLYERWLIVDKLLEGHSQREVKQMLSVSISKVTRGSMALQHGTGAFRSLWNRLKIAKK